MIRVLYISDTLRQRFGVTSVIMNYLEQLSGKDIQIDLLVYQNSEPAVIQRAEKFGATVYFMPELGLKKLSSFCGFIKSFFEKHDYDIVHSHFNQIDSIVFPIARKRGVRYCISHSHSTKLSERQIKAIRNRIMCWNILWNADIHAACSEKAGLALYGPIFKRDRKRLIIHNGINVNKYMFNPENRDMLRMSWQINANEILIGHIGSFNICKNQEFLVRLLQRLCKKNSRYKLVLVGDGETKNAIQTQAHSLGLSEKVIFAGTRSDVYKILSAVDLFVLPSLSEGLPIVGIEAQAAGLECLFSDSITREVDLTGARFLPLDHPDDWVEAIEQSRGIHHAEFSEMVAAKGYSIQEGSQKLLRVYRELMQSLNLDV